jgi:hypothetical protein
MSNEEIIVTIDDIRSINFCSRGARQWFARQGLDFHEFITKGLPISQVDAVGDALSKQVAAQARLRAAGDAE